MQMKLTYIIVIFVMCCLKASKASADLSSSVCGDTDHNRSVVGWRNDHEAAREAYLLKLYYDFN